MSKIEKYVLRVFFIFFLH